MLRHLCIALLIAASPIVGHTQEVGKKSASGIILPETLDGLAPLPSEGPQLPLDAHKGYTAPGEAVTIYVFRSTYPNAALWFERADAIIKRVWTSKGLGDSGKISTFSFGGSPVPNGMQRTYAMSGPNKSTSIAVIQIGQWLVKIRSTSTSLDVPSQEARMTRIIGALKTSDPIKTANPLTLPEDCAGGSHSVFDTLGSKVIAKPKGEAILMAGMVALTVAADAAGGPDSVAIVPEKYCRGALLGGDIAALYWRKDEKAKGWTMLLADSGRSMSGVPMPILDGKNTRDGGMLTTNTLERTEVLMLTQGGLPLADASVSLGFDQLMRSRPPLTSVEYGTTNISVALPK
jgi:hypothetical protein